MEDLLQMRNEKADLEEVGARPVIPAGTYVATLYKVSSFESGPNTRTPGRGCLTLTFRTEPGEDGTSHFIPMFVSPVPYRGGMNGDGEYHVYPKGHEKYTPAIPHDAKYKKWNQIARIVDPKGELTVGETLELLETRQVKIKLSELYEDAGKEVYWVNDDQDREEYRKAGYIGRNNIKQVWGI